MALSRDSEKCRKCEFYDKCDEKRMELCAYIETEDRINTLAAGVQYTMPNAISTTDIIDTTIKEAELREQIEKEIEKEMYRQLGCPYLRGNE